MNNIKRVTVVRCYEEEIQLIINYRPIKGKYYEILNEEILIYIKDNDPSVFNTIMHYYPTAKLVLY